MQVTFEPYNLITFKSYMQFATPEEFVNSIADTNAPGSPIHIRVIWANGILFRFFNQINSEAISKENLSGHIILDHIEFAVMKDYTKTMKIENKPMVTVDILDVSKHVVFNPLTAWIRDNLLITSK